MILRLYNCENAEFILDDIITVVEVENPKVFCNILSDLQNMVLPVKEMAVFENDALVKQSDIICINDIFNFNAASKNILSKLYKHIENYINYDINLRLKYEKIVAEYVQGILKLTSEFDIELCAEDNLDVKNTLAHVGLTPELDEGSILAKIISFIKICSELKLCKVVFLLNLKAYLAESDLETLYKYVLYYGVPFVLIESKHSEKLNKNEQKLFIDSEFCDIIYK